MQRYFISESDGIINILEKSIILTSSTVHHIKDVLRMSELDEILVVYKEMTYKCKITHISKQEVSLEIEDIISSNSELPCEVMIAQGLVRREKMETTIENISQLGASYYQPVILKRSNVKLPDDFNKKLPRLNKIATEACELAHRTKLLEVKDVLKFNEFLNLSKEYELCIVSHVESGNKVKLKDVIFNESKILILIGPEGGFDEAEIKMLKDANFKFVSLGQRVLRTELAPSYVMSVIDSIRGE